MNSQSETAPKMDGFIIGFGSPVALDKLNQGSENSKIDEWSSRKRWVNYKVG